MLTMNDVQALASRPERPENSVLTLYLDVDQSKQANLNRGFENQLKDMMLSVRNTIQNDAELNRFNVAAQRIEDFVGQYNIGARGLIVVFDASDGFFFSKEVDFPFHNQIRWSGNVLVQPLTVAIDEYERVGIVLLDRANVRLFTMFLGEIEEHLREGFDRKKVRHMKTRGMDDLIASDRAQRKADEQIRLNLRHIARDIEPLLDQYVVGRIILAGSPDITAELRGFLPKRLASRVIGVMDIASKATIEEVRNIAMPIAENFEREMEDRLVQDLVTSAAKSNRVVVGLGHTLFAVNQSRVWQLVCAEGFRSPGYECPRCAALFSTETDSCPACGSTVDGVEDVVERAVEQAVRKGARVEIIRGSEAESALINAGGIGAFLRTRAPSVRVS